MDLLKKKRTHVGLVLDRSGSMSHLRDEIIDAFNNQIKTLKETDEEAGEITVTVVTFGGTRQYTRLSTFPNIVDPSVFPGTTDVVDVVLNGEDPSDVRDLTKEDYNPAGMTPMYDGVGKTIEILRNFDDGGKDTAFLVVILSDGLENDSREWDADKISSEITELQDTGRWTFAYIGAEQDLADKAKHLGVLSTGVYTSTSAGMRDLSAGMTGATVSYMSGRTLGETQMNNYAEEATTKKEDDANGM